MGNKTPTISAAEYQKMLESLRKPVKRAKPNKYKAKRTEANGRSFPSKLEAAVFSIYEAMQKVGEIYDLKQYSTVHLSEAKIAWKIDGSFRIAETGELEYFEAKGVETPDYLIKLKLYKHYGPAKLSIWKGTAERPRLHETVIPRGLPLVLQFPE